MVVRLVVDVYQGRPLLRAEGRLSVTDRATRVEHLLPALQLRGDGPRAQSDRIDRGRRVVPPVPVGIAPPASGGEEDGGDQATDSSHFRLARVRSCRLTAPARRIISSQFE
jgi:hypothetical protein